VLAAGLLLLVAYYVCTRGVFQGKYSGDGWFGFHYLPALVYEQTLDMVKVMPDKQPFFGLDAVTHHMPNRCPFGPVYPWLPFYLIACGIAELGKLLGLFTLPNNSPFHAWMAGLGSLAMALVGYRQLYVLVERHLGKNAARIGATVAVWATPITWYAVTQPTYQHAAAFGLVVLLLERWDARRGDSSWRHFMWLGVIGGLAMSMRQQEVLWLIPPAGEVAWRLWKGPDRKRWLIAGAVFGFATLAAFAPQLGVFWYYTHTLAPPQAEPIRWGDPLVGMALFSTRAGLFTWTPVAYLALVGLIIGRKQVKAHRLALMMLVPFVIEVYICSAAWVPSGAYAYGARRLSDGAPLFGLGVALAYAAVEQRWKRNLVLGSAIFFVVLCLFTMEMQRFGKARSSGANARTVGMYIQDAGAKPTSWAVRAGDAVSLPWSLPAAIPYALLHGARLSTWDGVVGNFLLDRDGQWYTVLTKSLPLNWDNRAHLIEGLKIDPLKKVPAEVTGPVRILPFMFASESIGVALVGQVVEGASKVIWNGSEIATRRVQQGLAFEVPNQSVKAGTNELRLELPVGSKLNRLDFDSKTLWWREKK
jgi:hypothetical protein